MSLNSKRDASRLWAPTVIIVVATMLVAAAIDPDANLLRLRGMPRQERQRLIDNLQKFDLLYTADRQQALSDLDRRINDLDPERRAQYLVTLRRYHNWLKQLPETKQVELKDKAPGERLALVKKLVADYPITPNATTKFLQFVDVGDHSPFELADIYRIWQVLTPQERQQVEKLGTEAQRQHLIIRLADKKKFSSAVKPAEGDEEQWVSEFQTWVQDHRPALKKLHDNDAVGTEILRRQAINFHFLAPKNQLKAVTPEHLGEFLASFPPWLRSSFDHYPPAEARRRLSVVYRLVFPPGTEIKVGPPAPPAPAAGAARAKPAPPRPARGPEGKTASEPGSPPS